ncbi:GNAT family N-acetyltransferase [Leisingera sp. ANG59]|uniref:GNAT family N-acetyltransferase n=1 Tax=Leisingera sp. ANG59 TaxID=2675221 RepID=UPI001573536A|nr:GNAT family N-acetyltransferase [Leisingera sp. ANG59]NSY39572.1 hypothetical protein [Leisingera sp. ANG59]
MDAPVELPEDAPRDMTGDAAGHPQANPPARAAPGYRSAEYAEAFNGLGRPQPLPQCGSWLLGREIPGTALRDAMGLYPLLCCEDWAALPQELEAAGAAGLVSVTAVTDPLGAYDEALLKSCFSRAAPYKEHFIADLSAPLESFVSKSHRQNARRALRKVSVEVCDEPLRYLDDWVELYGVLAQKHGITGLRAFSRESFEQQFRVPGLVMFRAADEDGTVGLDLWYVDGDAAQGHLAAFSDRGYAKSASYATKWTLLNHFAGSKLRWVNFGGVASAAGSQGGGLAHFKQGWSNSSRQTWICGRIFDEQAYRQLTRGLPETSYFPAYRGGEF